MRPGLSVHTSRVARVKSGRKRDEIAAIPGGHLSERASETFSVESVRLKQSLLSPLRTKVFNSLRSSCTQIIETDQLAPTAEIVLRRPPRRSFQAIRNERRWIDYRRRFNGG